MYITLFQNIDFAMAFYITTTKTDLKTLINNLILRKLNFYSKNIYCSYKNTKKKLYTYFKIICEKSKMSIKFILLRVLKKQIKET